MQALIDYGVGLTIALQTHFSWMTPVMQFFSNLGTEDFYFLILPLLYWSIDAKIGIRVGMILVTGNMINFTAKLLFAGPRPYWVSSHVQSLWPESSFGNPSGHAQYGLSVWGTIAAFQKKWIKVVLGVVIFLIGFSRVYLGYHFPHDVVIGWLIGGVLLWAFLKYWDPVVAWLSGKTAGQQIMLAFIVSLIFILIGYSAAVSRSDFQLPVSWIENAARAGTEELDPVDPANSITPAGTFFGLTLGLAWINSLGGFKASGPIWMRALRFIIGLVGVVIFWMLLGEIFPRNDDLISYSLRFFRYTLVGWWISGGAPWIFARLKLIEV